MQGKSQFDDDAFIGRIDFGRYNDKQVAVTTYGDEVYVHIKDRSRGRALTLRGTDYLQLLKKKSQITTLLEQGGKHIAKKRRLEDSLFEDSVPMNVDSDTDCNIEETIRKLRKDVAAKKRLKLDEYVADAKKGLKGKKLKRTISAVSSLASTDVSSDEEKDSKRSDAKKKSAEERETSQSTPATKDEEEESDEGDSTPPVKRPIELKHLPELKKKHKKKQHNIN